MVQEDNMCVNSATVASRYSTQMTSRWRSSVVPAPNRVASVIPGEWRWILPEIFMWPTRRITACRNLSESKMWPMRELQDPKSKIPRRSKIQNPNGITQPQLLGCLVLGLGSWFLDLLWILDPGPRIVSVGLPKLHALPVHPPPLPAAVTPGASVGDLVCLEKRRADQQLAALDGAGNPHHRVVYVGICHCGPSMAAAARRDECFFCAGPFG